MKKGQDNTRPVKYLGYSVAGGSPRTSEATSRTPFWRERRVVQVGLAIFLVAGLAILGTWMVHRHALTQTVRAVQNGRPVIIEAAPWEILIVPQLLDTSQELVSLRYEGERAMTPDIKFSWDGHHGGPLLLPNVKLTRSMEIPASVIAGVTSSTALLRSPLKISWTADHTSHHTSVDLASGKLAPLTHRLLYAGHTKLWQISYAAETIHVAHSTLPQAMIRLRYLGRGKVGKYVEYSLETPETRRTPGVMDDAMPKRVTRDQIAVVSGNPAHMVFHIKWPGHAQSIVLTPQPPH